MSLPGYHGYKVWFITGASRGLGRIWAEATLKRGDKVAATARRLEDVADLKERFGDLVLLMALDVTEAEQVRQVVQQAHSHFGKLDVVLNNAGYTLFGSSAARRRPAWRDCCRRCFMD